MIFELFFLVCILPALKCSLVIDSGQQKGIYLNDYCPAMKYCPEGAHVMCMFYNPHQVLGPQCSNALNVSMTPDVADKLLEISNAIRSKIARGKETGKDGQHLPRGYGIFRLKWDSELATFAQVLANQCVLRHDLCRATKRFPDPGQTAGLVRFTYPDWFPYSQTANFSKPGLYGAKLLYAATQSIKSWYSHKNFVTRDMMVAYPDWSKNPNEQLGRLYLEMIYGPATHMGCGISAYTMFEFKENSPDLSCNSVQIICNYSAKPHTSAAVYNTVPPTDTDLPITNCGCPVGSVSDSECLCQYKNEATDRSTKTRSCNGASCEPTVVLLPIFTMDDTSPDHIFNSIHNISKSIQRSSIEINDIFDILPGNNKFIRNGNKDKYVMSSQKRFNIVNNPQSNYVTSIKNRYYDKKYDEPSEHRYRQSLRPSENHVPKKTSSIFTRVTRFVLPSKNSKPRTFSSVKRDVVPRKDFSDAKKLVDKYIYGDENLFKPKPDIMPVYIENDERRKNPNHIKEDMFDIKDISSRVTEATLNQAEQRIIHHNEYENDIQKDTAFREAIETVTLQTDSKLMSILDTLEKEVKHIELHEKDKEIFDKKIRKIYGKIVGKPVESLKARESHDVTEITKKAVARHDSPAKSSHTIFNVEEILDKHEFKNKNNHKSFEVYDEPTTIEQHIQKKLRNRNMYRNNDDTKAIDKRYRSKNNYRDIDHNEINSQEHKYDDFEYNHYRKNTFKPDHYSRRSGLRHENHDEHRRDMHKGYFMNHERERDPLSVDRRKYYQEKLDNIERRLSRARNYKRHRVPEERHMRAMISPHAPRKSENHIEPFYVADRARFLHGY